MATAFTAKNQAFDLQVGDCRSLPLPFRAHVMHTPMHYMYTDEKKLNKFNKNV